MKIMKKLITSSSPKILFLILLMSLSYSSAQGQIWNNIGSKVNDKLKKKADQKIEQKIDQSIDKSFDKTEQKIDESFQKNDQSSGEAKAPQGLDLSSMFGGTPELRDQYKFEFGITYQMSSTNSKGKAQDLPKMTMWMGESGVSAIHTNEQNTTMIMDMEKETMVIIQENEKTYMAIKSNFKAASEQILKASKDAANEEDIVTDDMKMEKIGSEKLLGYNCDIYKISSNETESKVWVTQDINFDYSKMAGGFSNSFGGKQKSSLPNVKGMPMGMMLKVITINNKSNETMTMEATEVFKNGTIFKLSSYKKLGMQ